MHLRLGLLLASLLIVSACGVSGSDVDARPSSSTTAPSSTAPPTTEDAADDPEDDTTTSLPELDETDLAEALPTERDLPDGFFEIDLDEELSEDDPFFDDGSAEEIELEAGPECEPVIDRLEVLLLDTPVYNGFANVDEVEVIASVALAGDDEREAFEGLDQLAACTTYREVYPDGEVDTYTLAFQITDLGELSFSVDVTITFEDAAEPPVGFTSVAVLHGDVVYTVDVFDGFSSTGTIPRDPALALAVAVAMDEKVGEIQAD